MRAGRLFPAAWLPFLLAVSLGCTSPKSPTGPRLPAQGEACPDGRCAQGLSCLSYHGVAGAAGPLIRTCEIPCGATAACPSGQTCVTIADGPNTPICRRR